MIRKAIYVPSERSKEFKQPHRSSFGGKGKWIYVIIHIQFVRHLKDFIKVLLVGEV